MKTWSESTPLLTKQSLYVFPFDPMCAQLLTLYPKHSHGRGGLGNISRSRSREPHGVVPGVSVHSSGRGGVGNIHLGRSLAETIDEEERKQLASQDGGM